MTEWQDHRKSVEALHRHVASLEWPLPTVVDPATSTSGAQEAEATFATALVAATLFEAFVHDATPQSLSSAITIMESQVANDATIDESFLETVVCALADIDQSADATGAEIADATAVATATVDAFTAALASCVPEPPQPISGNYD